MGREVVLLILALVTLAESVVQLQHDVNEVFGVAGEAVTSVLSVLTQRYCSVIIISDSNHNASTLYQKLIRLQNRNGYGVTMFQVVTKGRNRNQTHEQLSYAVAQARLVRRRLWCVTVIAASNDIRFLALLAKESRLGRLLVWRIRLVMVTMFDRSLIYDLMEKHWTLSMMNAVVLNVEQLSRCVVYQYLPYTPIGPQMVEAAVWTPERGIVTTSNLFFLKFNNFHGADFPVTNAIPGMPLIDLKQRRTPDGKIITEGVGREYIMLMEIAKSLNFTPSFKTTHILSESVMNVAQGIAMLMPQRLEMLPQFLKVVDHTVAIDPAPLSFVLPKPKSKPQWQSLYHPFQPMMWVLVISLNLIIPTAFILIAYAGGHMESETGVRTVRVLLWQDQGRLPTLAPSRLLLLGWMIFALLIGVSYRCKLTAFLTVRKFPERPETVQELAKTGIPSIFPTSIPWIRDFFLTSQVSATREIGKNSFFVESAAGGMAAMAANKGANFYERNMIRLSLAENYTNPDGTTDYYIARGTAIPTYGAWFIPHDAPYKDNIDIILFRMIEGGLKDFWMERTIQNAELEFRMKWKAQQHNPGGQTGGNNNSSENVSPGQRQPFTLYQLQGPLWLLTFALMVSIVCFLTEVIVDHVKDK